jgi:hypothetical protein
MVVSFFSALNLTHIVSYLLLCFNWGALKAQPKLTISDSIVCSFPGSFSLSWSDLPPKVDEVQWWFTTSGCQNYNFNSPGSTQANYTIFCCGDYSLTSHAFDTTSSPGNTILVASHSYVVRIYCEGLTVSTLSSVICVGESTNIYATGLSPHTWYYKNNMIGQNQVLTVSPAVGQNYYKVEAGLGPCLTSDSILIDVQKCLGEEEQSSFISTCLYPNPSDNMIKINTTLQGPISYFIANTYGILVTSGIVDDYRSVDVSALPPGLYLLQLHSGTTCIVLRLQKE